MYHEMHLGNHTVTGVQLLELSVMRTYFLRQIADQIFCGSWAEQDVYNPHHKKIIFPIGVSFWN